MNRIRARLTRWALITAWALTMYVVMSLAGAAGAAGGLPR